MPYALAASLVQALAQRLDAALVETHISWVLLTPTLVYKVKKPLRLPFVDYGSLAQRRQCCEEELRLNARLAPSLYLGLTRITGNPQVPGLDGPGPTLEYAVRMRRFADGALFAEQLQAGVLAPPAVDALAALLAEFHLRAPRAEPGSSYGQPERHLTAALAALEAVGEALAPTAWQHLHGWLLAEAKRLTPLWAARQAASWVRECHGDLHLQNIVSLDGGVAAFDGIEFDPALRWIDVIDDLAFAVMDFDALGRADCAFRLLNGWLEATGDFDGLAALRFAVVYRALVRAQVSLLRGADAPAVQRYLDCAQRWTEPRTGILIITHGLPGSGKTWASQQLLERLGAVRLRSDVERKRLHGLTAQADSRALGLDLYQADATRRTYERLFVLAAQVLDAGFPVVLDAAFLRRGERDQARALAASRGVRLVIQHCEAPLTVLHQRLRARQGDASEADGAVLEKLRSVAEPLGDDEAGECLPTAPFQGPASDPQSLD